MLNTNSHIKYADVDKHLHEGLIRMQTHPDFPNLKILNYTQECQFKKIWTPLTRMARGLVVDFDEIDGYKALLHSVEDMNGNEITVYDEMEVYTIASQDALDHWLT